MAKMDERCPRKLKDMPCEWCPLAVLRLRAIRHSDKVLTENEESKLPGCPWAVADQTSNYCFFKYAERFSNGQPLSVNETAQLLMITPEEVRKVEKRAFEKIKKSSFIQDVLKNKGSDPVFSDSPSPDEEYNIGGI